MFNTVDKYNCNPPCLPYDKVNVILMERKRILFFYISLIPLKFCKFRQNLPRTYTEHRKKVEVKYVMGMDNDLLAWYAHSTAILLPFV